MENILVRETTAESMPVRVARGGHPEESKTRVVFLHASTYIALSLVVLHQAVVASSTIFLTRVIEQFQSGQPYATSLALYLAAMAFPYLPGCVSFLFLQRWINNAHQAFVALVARRMREGVGQYRNEKRRERVTAILARNAFSVLRDYISFIHDLASFTLNSILSMAVISFLLPADILVGYGVSLALCFVIIVALRGTIARASSDYENLYLDYSTVLDVGWQNLTIGNRHNAAVWQSRKENTGRAFYACANRLEAKKQISNILLAATSLAPTIYIVLAIVYDKNWNPPAIAAVIVSLTRIFLIINSLSALVHRVLDWSAMQSRLNVLFSVRDSLSEEVSLDSGAIEGIAVNGVAISGKSDLLDYFSTILKGRYRIAGPNGSGKSTALMELKREYGAQCVMLPANHTGLMWLADGKNLSTGQRTVMCLQEVLQQDDVKYILLDEWDANLDSSNASAVDVMLDALAERKVIVEVRHMRRG
jgi:ABC-type multidrug transport system fused ATPase/permease subunit